MWCILAGLSSALGLSCQQQQVASRHPSNLQLLPIASSKITSYFSFFIIYDIVYFELITQYLIDEYKMKYFL